MLNMANDTPLSPVLSEIAQRYFGNETLETQSSDALDSHLIEQALCLQNWVKLVSV